MGDTLTHEVGHWLYLAHTFEGGCSGNGDGVDDTPAVKEPNYGCPRNINSCSGGGNDLIENFMDYTDDDCMDSFTNGQFERALAAWERYRASCDGLTKYECKREDNCVFDKKKKIFKACELRGKYKKVDCESRSLNKCERKDTVNNVGVCMVLGNECVSKCDVKSEKICKKMKGTFNSNKKICKALKKKNPCWKCQPTSTCGP